MNQIKYVSIKELTLFEQNPRTITREQFEKLKQNIERDPEYFERRPCLVNESGGTLTIYAGNQRYRAAKALGQKEVPCIVDQDVPEDTIKKRIVLDNLHHGEFDWDILASIYDPQELLELGMKEIDLHLEELDPKEEIVEETEEDKRSQLKKCPSCGHEFT